jgi:hypothetical protein
MTTNCCYLYGVVPADRARALGPIGLGGAEVRIVADGGMGIVTSTLAPIVFSAIPPEQTLQHLAQHQRVLERAMLDGPVVPVKFGTFCEQAPEDAEVVRVLRSGCKAFAAALENYAGKVEFDMAVSWTDLRSVLAGIARDQAVVSMKAQITSCAQPTLEQRIRLGQLVKEMLDRRNKVVADALVATLGTRWRPMIVNPTRDDSAVLSAAVLIDRAEEAEFDRALEQLNRSYDDRLKFRRVGPLPPYSFATAEVKTVPAGKLDAARRLLGLGESASLAEIKTAYRQLLQELHPDRNTQSEAAGRLQDISAAHELLEEYAQNFQHTFNGTQASPVIVTVRSLDDLRAGPRGFAGRDASYRRDGREAAAA